MSAVNYDLPDDLDCEILVCRSHLDREVWVCVPSNYPGASSADLLSPGRIRAVKRNAESRFNDGEPAHWVRRDPDTWVMQQLD